MESKAFFFRGSHLAIKCLTGRVFRLDKQLHGPPPAVQVPWEEAQIGKQDPMSIVSYLGKIANLRNIFQMGWN